MQNIATVPTKQNPLRRLCVRWFVLLALITIAIDTAPKSQFITPLQEFIRPALNVLGLWQGDWPLFAPNPIINNGWISAEFYHEGNASPIMASDGKPLSWNSPIWSERSAWNKFYQFRHMNYFNRVPYRGKNVLDDLADFVARSKLGTDFHFVESQTTGGSYDEVSGATELRMSKNGLQIVMPEDGSLPPPEETTWIYVGSGLGIRKYAQ